jgi:hypothetical protein
MTNWQVAQSIVQIGVLYSCLNVGASTRGTRLLMVFVFSLAGTFDQILPAIHYILTFILGIVNGVN